MKKNKVLVIGWDAADWKIINKLMDKGEMPSMEKLVNNGTIGNIATLDPPYSPMLWTTIATGVRPDKHGILGFVEPTPDQMGIRPVSSTSRKVKAIWNILTQEGYKTHVVGWWPSHPAEPINGIMISNHYQEVEDEEFKPLPKGTVYPAELTRFFSHLRVHPSELTQEHILPFLNSAHKIDQEKDKKLFSLSKILSEATTIHAATTWIAENQEWDFLAVYLDAIDHFCHGFMNYYPPKMKGVTDLDFEIYNGVVEGAYKYHDMMLGRLMELAGEDTTIILVSDHGFHSDHLRPKLLPDEPAGPAFQHRDMGVFCIKGPNIKKDERIYGASLLDITPTLLYLLDLPIGEDMDGVPLVQAFENIREVKTIPSWEKVEGNSGMLPKTLQEDPYEASASLQQLVDLGYIDPPEEDMQKNVDKIIEESEYNLARVYMGARMFDKAIPLLTKLFEKHPYEGRFAFRLIESYRHQGSTHNISDIVDKFREKINERIISDEELEKIKKSKMPDGLGKKEKEKWQIEKRDKLLRNRRIFKDLLQAELVDGEILVDTGKYNEAIEKYSKIEKVASNSSNVLNRIAVAYTKMGIWDKAIEYYKKALKINPEDHNAFMGLSACYLSLQEYELAAENALESIGIIYHNSNSHFYLAQALIGMKEYQAAENALQVCIAITPTFNKARNKLIELYENELNNPIAASKLKEYFTAKIENKTIQDKDISVSFENNLNVNISQNKSKLETIFVVSGLPRSGTSLMMQMLEQAGLDIFTDNVRVPDISNPKGYYEHEAVKRLAIDKSWVNQATGKVVKVISHLLQHLPTTYFYKIVFMVRDIDEVVKSQNKMLVKNGKAKKEAFSISLKMSYQKNIEKVQEWVKFNYNLQILYVNYKDVLTNPLEESRKILKFLNVEADEKKMAKVVDKSLYRTK